MSSDNHFVKLDQAIRKYIRSEKVQRELFEDIAIKFLKSQVKTQTQFSTNGISFPWETLEFTPTQFSSALIHSVTAVITDEFKK